jgi:hypothetical protein
MASKHYLSTVSAVAIGSAALYGATAAQAQSDDGFTLTFQGGLGDATGGLSDSFDSGGGSEQSSIGQLGGMMLNRSFGNVEASVALRFYNQSDSQILSGFSSGGGFVQPTTGTSTSWKTFDVNAAVPAAGVKGLDWLLGARLMQFDTSARIDFSGISSGGGSGGSIDLGVFGRTSFTGLGPRIGARYATGPVIGSVGFAGEVGAAFMYGRVEETTVASISSGGGTGITFESGGSSEMRMATNIDMSLQAHYYLSERSTLSLGWHSEGMVDLSDLGSETRTHSLTFGFTTEF